MKGGNKEAAFQAVAHVGGGRNAARLGAYGSPRWLMMSAT